MKAVPELTLKAAVGIMDNICRGKVRDYEEDTVSYCALDQGHEGPCQFRLIFANASKPVPFTISKRSTSAQVKK